MILAALVAPLTEQHKSKAAKTYKAIAVASLAALAGFFPLGDGTLAVSTTLTEQCLLPS